MKLTLPFPPSTNRMWRNYRGVVVSSAESRSYKEAVALLCRAQKIKPLAGNVQWHAVIYFKRNAGDLTNRLKIVEDSLNGHAWGDDAQVKCQSSVWMLDRDEPRIEIEIQPWAGRGSVEWATDALKRVLVKISNFVVGNQN